MMNENKRTPQIRFKGFTDDWEQRKLTDFVEFYNGQTYSPLNVQDNGTLVLRSSNVQNGEISTADSVFIDSRVINTNNVKIGDIIVVVRNGSRNLIGKHAQIKDKMPNTVIGAFMTGIRTNNSNFVNSLLNTPIFDNEINKNMGATINQITGYMFSNMEFKIPKNDEQEKIGKLFNNIDNLITLHQRKYDKLVNMKKSMLEKMFPKNSEKVPEIRFKGFTDDWEQRKWSDCVDISNNMVDPRTGKYDKLPHIGPGNIESFTGQFYDNIKTVGEENLISGKFHFFPGDIIYGKINPQLGKYVLPLFEGLSSADSYVLNSKNGLAQKYLFTILQTKDFYKYSTSVSMRSGMPKINRDELNSYEFNVPNFSEQKKIGTLFTNIDNLITLHQRKLEKLNNLKKSMLEKMFV